MPRVVDKYGATLGVGAEGPFVTHCVDNPPDGESAGVSNLVGVQLGVSTLVGVNPCTALGDNEFKTVGANDGDCRNVGSNCEKDAQLCLPYVTGT